MRGSPGAVGASVRCVGLGPLGVWGLSLLGGCGLSASKFSEQYVDGYCTKAVVCGNLNVWDSFEDCVATVGAEQPAASDTCTFDKDQAKACLDEVETATCDNLAVLASCAAAFSGDCGTTTTTTDTGPDYVSDLFEQTQVSPVDVLWVLDGHSEVTKDLTALVDPMWEVMLLADPDWKMGVLDATVTNNNFALLSAKWFTWPPPANAFRVSTGSADPRLRQVVYSAFELRGQTPQNKDFLRSGSHLYVLYVTDRADASDNEVVNERDYVQWLEDNVTDPRVGVITDSDHRRDYEDLVLGGGSVFLDRDPAAAVRGALLEAIGLETSFTLTREPLDPPDSVEVIYRNHADVYTLDRDYTWDRPSRTLTFKRVIPPPGSVVRVTYVEEAPATTTSSGE